MLLQCIRCTTDHVHAQTRTQVQSTSSALPKCTARWQHLATAAMAVYETLWCLDEHVDKCSAWAWWQMTQTLRLSKVLGLQFPWLPNWNENMLLCPSSLVASLCYSRTITTLQVTTGGVCSAFFFFLTRTPKPPCESGWGRLRGVFKGRSCWLWTCRSTYWLYSLYSLKLFRWEILSK